MNNRSNMDNRLNMDNISNGDIIMINLNSLNIILEKQELFIINNKYILINPCGLSYIYGNEEGYKLYLKLEEENKKKIEIIKNKLCIIRGLEKHNINSILELLESIDNKKKDNRLLEDLEDLEYDVYC